MGVCGGRTVDPGEQHEGGGGVADHHLGGEFGGIADRPRAYPAACTGTELADQIPVHAARKNGTAASASKLRKRQHLGLYDPWNGNVLAFAMPRTQSGHQSTGQQRCRLDKSQCSKHEQDGRCPCLLVSIRSGVALLIQDDRPDSGHAGRMAQQ